MQGILNNDHPPLELKIFEMLVNENIDGDQYAMPINTIRSLRDYAKASKVILILFELENPDWANKKVLGTGQEWESESAFLRKDSILCHAIPEEIRHIDYSSERDAEFDPIIYSELAIPIKNVIVAPLRVNGTSLGAMIFINPAIDPNKEESYKFLQLITKVLTKAIQTTRNSQQLIVTNADLEATNWQILNSRNTLRAFFDNMPSSVLIVDRSYKVVAINNHRCERVDKTPKDIVGEKCYEQLHAQSAPCPGCRVADALNGIPSVYTERQLESNKVFRDWEISTIPIKEEDNTINRVIIFEEDITEKLIMEANLIQSEKMASIGQLAASVAHEINNPLAAIIANAQLLIRDLGDADEDILESLQLIETAGERAAKIVNNLLESARKEKHYEFEDISLNETILDAISLLRYEINKRAISIQMDLSNNLPSIYANKNQLRGVWINLLNNAIGAIESNKGKVSISTRYGSKQFQVIISDNGKGILPEHQDHIFEPFFTTKEIGKGTGLGLSVSLQAIKEHHGDIEFESKAGKGTKFIITLPDIVDNDY